MSKIRVLIVDDTVVVRQFVRKIFESEPGIEVVGTAANGRIAIAKIPEVNPDIVILDVEMPEMGGLEALEVMQRDYPSVRVIMFSTITERGATATLDALALGASTYVTKPTNAASLTDAMEEVRGELVPKVRALGGGATTPSSPPPSLSAARTSAIRPPEAYTTGPPDPVEIVAIATSTGGPNALHHVLPLIRSDFPVPIVIVQHMPPLFTKLFADRLTTKTQLPVREGAPGEDLRSGAIWIAPGGYHMVVQRSRRGVSLNTNQEMPENSCRPAADVLFRSVADIYGSGTLAVVLTGMGHDGLRGCEQIRESGGWVMVQDEETSVVWGMPGAVAQAGLADRVLPLSEIIPKLDAVVRTSRHASSPKESALA